MADFKIVYTDNVFGNNLIEKRRYKDVAFKYVEASDFDEDTLKKNVQMRTRLSVVTLKLRPA